MTKRQGCQKLAGSARADRSVVLQRNNLSKKCAVSTGQPCQAQAWQPVDFTDRAKAERAFVQIASRGQARVWVVLQLAVDLITKNINTTLCGKLYNTMKHVRSHKQSSGIVRRIDIN